MPSGDTGMTDIFERAVDNSVQNVLDAIEQAMGLMGPRPFGAVAGSREENIEYYLQTRDDPNAWEQEIVRRATEIAKDNPDGARQTAEIETAIDAWEMEQALDRAGGAEAVMAALAMKRLGNAQRAVAKAEHMLDRPRIVVRPPLGPVPTPLELLGIDANKVLEGAISGDGVPRPNDSAPSAAMPGAVPMPGAA